MKLFGKSKPQEPLKPEKEIKTPSRDVRSKENNRSDQPEPVKEVKPPESTPEKGQNSKLFSPFLRKSTDLDQGDIKGSAKTIIGKTITITGEISGNEEVFIEGRVTGDIILGSKLGIGVSGIVDGKVEAQQIRISGKVNGQLNAIDKLEIASTGDVVGEMNSPRIIVVEGASLDGKMTTTRKNIIENQTKESDPPSDVQKETEIEPESPPDQDQTEDNSTVDLDSEQSKNDNPLTENEQTDDSDISDNESQKNSQEESQMELPFSPANNSQNNNYKKKKKSKRR